MTKYELAKILFALYCTFGEKKAKILLDKMLVRIYNQLCKLC